VLLHRRTLALARRHRRVVRFASWRRFPAWHNGPDIRAYADRERRSGTRPRGRAPCRLGANTFDHIVFLNRAIGSRPMHCRRKRNWHPPSTRIADFKWRWERGSVPQPDFFATDVATPRYVPAAACCCSRRRRWVRGRARPAPGLLVYGEQARRAYADFDGEWAAGLAVSENGAPTRLSGIAARLPVSACASSGRRGGGNPTGIGTQMRLRYGDSAGPVREFRRARLLVGNGAVQVLGRAAHRLRSGSAGRAAVSRHSHSAGQRESRFTLLNKEGAGSLPPSFSAHIVLLKSASHWQEARQITRPCVSARHGTDRRGSPASTLPTDADISGAAWSPNV